MPIVSEIDTVEHLGFTNPLVIPDRYGYYSCSHFVLSKNVAQENDLIIRTELAISQGRGTQHILDTPEVIIPLKQPSEVFSGVKLHLPDTSDILTEGELTNTPRLTETVFVREEKKIYNSNRYVALKNEDIFVAIGTPLRQPLKNGTIRMGFAVESVIVRRGQNNGMREHHQQPRNMQPVGSRR